MPQKKNIKKEIPLSPSVSDGLHIIAIGASAGGLEALQEFLSHLPALQNTTIIVAQHLSPTHKSLLVQLLSRETKLAVEEAKNGTMVEANKIYITPPDEEISIKGGKIRLQKPVSRSGPKPSVNVLFNSLAKEAGKNVLGIILSGTGTDGAQGVSAIKKAGGFIIVQDPSTAKYDGMPQAAIQTGNADLILAPEKMGDEILEHFLHPDQLRIKQTHDQTSQSSFDQIIRILSKKSGTDFSNYKSATIIRRLEKRMAQLKIKSIDEYLKLLENNTKEQQEMFNMILIGVTSFFRDTEAFGMLENVLHKIVNAKTDKDPIRIWVPGCFTGEEAYSIAILMHRIIKDRKQPFLVQIFATDIDEKAIAIARKGVFSPTSLENVPEEIINTYFTAQGNQYELVKAIRSMVLFSKHDVTNNPPFLKLDLISCRNLLIYFGNALQQQIIPIFHYALQQDGYLFLGKSETIGQYADLFSVIDGKDKIFQRKRGGNLHSIKFSAFKAQKQTLPQHAVKKIKAISISDQVKETLFNTYEHPYVVINEEFDILEINGDVRLFMTLAQGSIHANMMKMINPELQIEVRSIITNAIKRRESVRSSIKKFDLFGSQHYVRITAKPLLFTESADELFIVIFEKLDLAEYLTKGIVTNEEEIVNLRIQELEHELAASKEHLQTYIEELETNNEEMQSLNEEMQSTNEELQSTNEELETSNEELQSTNEEIQITYTELKAANEELERKEERLKENEANLNALLKNQLQGFVLIDKTYKIVAFNEQADSIFKKLRNNKLTTGDSIIDSLEPGQLEFFLNDFNRVTKNEILTREIELKSTDGDTRWFQLNYTPVSITKDSAIGISIGILDISDLKVALSTLNEKEKLLSSVFNATSIGLCITNDKGNIIDVNLAYCQIYGFKKEELIGQHFTLSLAPEQRAEAQKQHDNFIESGMEPAAEWKVYKKSGDSLLVYVTAERMILPNGKKLKITSIRDITEQKKTLKAIETSRQKYKALIDNSLSAIFLTKPTGQILEANSAARKMFGYTEPELQQLGRQGIIDHNDNNINKILEERAQTGKARGELTGIKKSGERFPIEFTSAIFRDAYGEEFTYTLLNDISEKKAAEQKLQTSERRFRAMVENGADVIVILNEQGNPTYISPGVFRIVGYTQEEALQLKGTISIHPDDLAYAMGKLRESMENPGVPLKNIQYRIRHKSGQWIWVESTINSLLHDPAVAGIVTNFSDITEKKLIETQLSSITDNLNGVVFRYKLFPDGTDQLMYLSKGSNDLWGIEAEAAMKNNKLIWDLYHEEDLQGHLESIQLSKETLQSWSHEWRVRMPDGSIRWQRGTGNPQRLDDGSTIWDSIIVDITALKEQELEINRIKRNQESLINGTEDLIWSIDKDLKIITANQAYLEMMKAAAGITLHEGDYVIVEEFGEELVTKWKAYYQRGLAGESFSVNEKVFHPVSQSLSYGLITFNPMYNSEGAVFGLSCYSKDITDLVLNQQAAENSRLELQKVLDYSPDVICTINEAGCFVKVSEASLSIWGYKPAELIGNPYIDLVHPADHEKTNAAAAAILSGQGLTNFENRYLHKNGSTVPIVWSAKWDETEKLMFCVAKDATEKKKAEEALVISEKKYKDLFESNPSPMFIWEFGTLAIIDCNEEALLKYGYTREEFLQLTIRDIRPAEDIERLEKVTASEESYGKIHNQVWRHIKKSGELFNVEVNGHVIDYNGTRASLVMITDITDKLKAEEELKASEEKYRILFLYSPIPKWIYDLESYRILDVNHAAIVHYGYSREEFLAKNIQEIHITPDHPRLLTAHEDISEKNDTIHLGLFGHLKKDGSLIQAEVSGNQFAFNDKSCMIVECVDVTEMKATEEQLRFSEALLAEAQRLAKLGSWNFDFRQDKLTWSDELYGVFGTDKNTFKETHGTFVDLVDEADQELVRKTSKNAQETGEPFNIEYHITTPTGEKRIIEEFGSAEKDETGKIVRLYGTAQDITERKLAEEKVKESNLRYQNVTKATYDAIWDWDLLTGKIFRAEGFKTSFGFDLESLNSPELRWSDFILPADREEADKSIANAIAGQENYWKHEYRIIKPDNEVAYVQDRAYIIRNLQGKAIRVVGALRDISESRYYHQLETLEKDVLEMNALQTHSLYEVLERYIKGIENLHSGVACSMMEVKNKQLYHLVAPSLPDAYLQAINGLEIGEKSGSCGTAAFLNKKIVAANIATDERWVPFRQIAAKYGLKACWCNPITNSNNEVVATLAVYYFQSKIPGHYEENTIQRANNIIKVILEGYKKNQALAESNQRYEHVTKATFDAIWDWDIAESKVHWGEAYDLIFGNPAEPGLTDLEKVKCRLHPADLDMIMTSARQALKGSDMNWELEHRYKKADGTYAFVSNRASIIRNTEGKPTRVIGAMQDITRKKQEEQRLKLMSSVVTNTNDAVLITEAEPFDEPGPRIIYVNEAFTKLTGYSAEEAVGKTPRILQGPRSDRKELNRLKTALKNWESCEITTVNYKKTGEEFWINFTVSPVADEKGWFTHWIAIERDVTKKKNEELQQQLISEISQVFNEPINLKLTLDKVLAHIALFGDFALCEAWLVSTDKKEIQFVSGYGRDAQTKSFIEAGAALKTIKKGEGLPGQAWLNKTLILWSSLDKKTEFLRCQEAKKVGLKTVIALPMIYQNDVAGVLILGLNRDEKETSNLVSLFKNLKEYLGSEVKRKKLEQELNQMFDFAPDIIVIAGNDGYYKKINQAGCSLLEYSEEELLNTPYLDLIHPEEREKAKNTTIQVLNGHPIYYYETRFLTKTGKTKWIAWTATASPGENVIFGVGKDITEKKELENLLNTANSLARIGGWEVDLIKNSIFWSDMTKKIHELEAENEPDLETAINYYEEGVHRNKIKFYVKNAVEQGQPWDDEFKIITEKGNERWVRTIGEAEMVNQRCVRIFGSFQDIDERKRAELAVKETLQEKNNILESIGDAFIALDQNWTINYWNYVAESVLGRKRQDVIGQNFWELFADAIDSEFYRHYQLAITEKKVQHFEAYYDSVNKWFEVNAYPSKQGLSIFFRDITARKQSELQLKQLNEDLQKQAKELEISNRELEQFAYVASHDLQEPLRMVSNFLTQLHKKYEGIFDDRAKKYIRFAVEGAARMREIILDLLEFSKIGRIDEKVQTVDLNALINEILLLYSKKIEETQAVITFKKLPAVNGYKTPLRQVFQNLISNALKYTRPGVRPLISITCENHQTHWLFNISDNGIGIHQEYFNRIFVIFQRLHKKEEYAGTGMGLAVTKKIIDSLNGKIWLESVEGKGTTFYFSIPKV